MKLFKVLPLLVAGAVVCAGCEDGTPVSGPAEVEEIRPGIIRGYLDESEQPDSLNLVPAPPEEGSAAFARDVEIAQSVAAMVDTPAWEQAKRDANLRMPESINAFSAIIGLQISEEQTPHLYQLLRRAMADAGLSGYKAKNHYTRQRPFMSNGQPICTPEEEDFLRGDPSYPSSHTALGWAWGLLLAEIVPQHADSLLKRGYDYGQSRVVCNVHWQSDVDAGRIIGAAAVARIHANPTFQKDLKEAKKEAARLMNQ